MNGRSAAQGSNTEVKILSRCIVNGINRNRRIVNVYDYTQQVLYVQFPRLWWYISMRIMQAEKRFQVFFLALGDYLPVILFVKPVNHYSVVAGDSLCTLGDQLAQFHEGFCVLHVSKEQLRLFVNVS